MFIFTSVLMVSLSTVLYLMARALPRIVEDPQAQAERHGFLDRWGRSHIPEKVDAALNGFLLKFLRKLKVLVLKLDNALAKHLEKVKPEENSKKPNIDFKEIAGQNGVSQKNETEN